MDSVEAEKSTSGTPIRTNVGEEARREPVGHETIKRSLQQRHLSMIALAGMIGTGLFLSSGRALANAGPLGCLLAFIIMGTVTASIAYISAEMSAFKPVEAGFIRHANMWLDRSTGIAVGWNFWYSMVITMPAEISAATTLVGFWNPTLNQSIIADRTTSHLGVTGHRSPMTPIFSIFWIAIALINFAPVRTYGEFEFYFAFLKIALIIFFIIGGITLDLGGFPQQTFIGSRYWKEPYHLFRDFTASGGEGRFLGFWSAMISAAFAYGNVQVVAIAGAETQNPRKAIPNALRRTFTRVVVFYVASIFVISLIVPANDPRLSLPTGDVTHSPFLIAFSNAGIKAVPSVMNAIILSSAFSSGNACTFLASRTLHGLALDGHAPAVFLRLNRFRVPYVAVAASVVWGAIAYTGLNQGSSQAFIWLVALVTTAGLISWIIVCITYLRFFYATKAQHLSRDSLPYKSPLQPYLTYYALVMNILVLIFSGWDSFSPKFNVTSFMSNYLNCILFPLLYLVCKAWLRDPIVPLEAIDIRSELDLIKLERHEDLQGQAQNEEFKTTRYDRILNYLF